MNNSINKKDIIPGRNVVGMFMAINKKYSKTGVSALFLIEMHHWMYEQGFRNALGRMTSIALVHHLLSMDGEITAEKTIELKGKKFKLWFTKLPQTPLFTN